MEFILPQKNIRMVKIVVDVLVLSFLYAEYALNIRIYWDI